MRVEVDPDMVFKKTADSRGRVTLGAEYSGEQLEIAVLKRGVEE